VFFFEKKNQKTFTFFDAPTIEARAWIVPRAPEIKVFLLLFRKTKEDLA
jgi:hypothetical protein